MFYYFLKHWRSNGDTVHIRPCIIISCTHNIGVTRGGDDGFTKLQPSRQETNRGETESRWRGGIGKRWKERQRWGCGGRNGFGSSWGCRWLGRCHETQHIKATFSVWRLWWQRQRWLVIEAGCWAQETDALPVSRKTCKAERRCRWLHTRIDKFGAAAKANSYLPSGTRDGWCGNWV